MSARHFVAPRLLALFVGLLTVEASSIWAALVTAPRKAVWLSMCAAFALLCSAAPAAAQLLNPGFETDALTAQDPVPFATDWNLANTGEKNTASAPNHPVRSGVGSLQLVGFGGFGVPLGLQTFPAEAGQTWDLQGYIRTEAALTGGTRALLKIVFRDVNLAMDLEPASIAIGTADAQPFPGIISAPQLTNSTAVGEWVFAQAQGVAPAGTTEVSFFCILVDENPATAYFDDLQAGLVVPTVPGDFDGDGDVDDEDLGDWKAAYGMTDAGNADNDGDSDGNDFLIWQQNLAPGTAEASAIPEPAAIVVVTTGIVLLAGASRRRLT